MKRNVNVPANNMAEAIARASLKIMDMPDVKKNLSDVTFESLLKNTNKPPSYIFLDGIRHGISAALLLIYSGKVNLTFLEKESEEEHGKSSD